MSDFHMKVEMTGDRDENTRRRAAAYGVAFTHGATDPLVKLRMALGRAYSDLHMGTHRNVVIARIRDLLAEPDYRAVAGNYCRCLADIQAARSQGDRTGDHIGRVQLDLLTEALEPQKEPDNAA